MEAFALGLKVKGKKYGRTSLTFLHIFKEIKYAARSESLL